MKQAQTVIADACLEKWQAAKTLTAALVTSNPITSHGGITTWLGSNIESVIVACALRICRARIAHTAAQAIALNDAKQIGPHGF